MPKVPPEVAAQHDEMRRKQGAELGCHCCPVCGDSNWKLEFHDTPYFVGNLKTDAGREYPSQKGIEVLCEPCWEKLTPADRLPHYMARCDLWQSSIKTVTKIAGPGGAAIDNPHDVARRARELAEHESERELIRQAVLAGK